MMQRMLLLLLFLASLMLTQGCASPAKVPTLEDDSISPVTLKFLKNRTLQLSVRNERKINQEEGNTPEIEAAVFKAVSGACLKGGLQVNTTSKAHLNVQILDYDGPSQDGVCVKVRASLSVPGIQRTSEAFACQQLKHITGIKLGGNVSEAYKVALNFAFQELEK